MHAPVGEPLQPGRLRQLVPDGPDPDEVVGQQALGGGDVAVALGGGPGRDEGGEVVHGVAPHRSMSHHLP